MIIDQEIDKRLLILKVIWFAMLMSLVTYLFVGLYAAANVGPLMKEDTVGMLRPFFTWYHSSSSLLSGISESFF